MITSDLEKDRIVELLSNVESLLSNISIDLSSSERRSMCSIGDSRTAFITKTLEILKTEDVLLTTIDPSRLEGLFDASNQYLELMQVFDGLYKKLSDMYLYMGNQTFLEAKSIRKKMEAAAIIQPELQKTLKTLSILQRKNSEVSESK